MLSAAQAARHAAAAALALLGQAALPGVHPPAHRGLQELHRPGRAAAPGRRGRRRAADRGRRAVPADRSAHAGVGGPAHHEAARRSGPTAGGGSQFLKLREAQRTPTHWGLEPACPLARLLPRIEPRGRRPGHRQRRRAGGLSARGARRRRHLPRRRPRMRRAGRVAHGHRGAGQHVRGIRRPGRALACPISSTSSAPLDLVVLDPGALTELSAACRMEFIADLQRLSRPGGVHVILPSCPSLAPDSLLSFYDGWTVEEGGRRRRRTPGVARPRRPRALESAVSRGHDGPALHRVITTRRGRRRNSEDSLNSNHLQKHPARHAGCLSIGPSASHPG